MLFVQFRLPVVPAKFPGCGMAEIFIVAQGFVPFGLKILVKMPAARFLARQGISRAELDGYVCHPGGAKVIDALEEAFELAPGELAEARSVLRDYGNMSAASVLFVLERALAQGLSGRHLMSSLGPGFTAAFALIEGGKQDTTGAWSAA